jgi:SAM-dependent methyltransferase
MNDSGEMKSQAEKRLVGTEAGKTIQAKYSSGFVARYLSGANILDIGYRGYNNNAEPIVPQAIGIDLAYPGYDGKTLPFEDNSQDAVYSSHCLEHIEDYVGALREWYRVLRIGGFMILSVPHQFLYEKKPTLPSRWNPDHKRFYTPASLMAEVEGSLVPNTYRLRHLVDNDQGFTYRLPPEMHPGGCYEIEMVLEKIREPAWKAIPDLVDVDIDPNSDLINWVGFRPPEHGFRWTDGMRASMQFNLTTAGAEAVQASHARVVLTLDTFGKQRIHASINNAPVFNGTRNGNGLLLDIPTARLRSGLNSIDFYLPNAIHPASSKDLFHLGIAIRNVKLVRAASPRTYSASIRGIWNSIAYIFNRA